MPKKQALIQRCPFLKINWTGCETTQAGLRFAKRKQKELANLLLSIFCVSCLHPLDLFPVHRNRWYKLYPVSVCKARKLFHCTENRWLYRTLCNGDIGWTPWTSGHNLGSDKPTLCHLVSTQALCVQARRRLGPVVQWRKAYLYALNNYFIEYKSYNY